jgi:hypothetical protein
MKLASFCFFFLAAHFLPGSAVPPSEISAEMASEAAYVNEEPLLYDLFPEDFKWGVATASYQVRTYLCRGSRCGSAVKW